MQSIHRTATRETFPLVRTKECCQALSKNKKGKTEVRPDKDRGQKNMTACSIICMQSKKQTEVS